MKVKFIRIGAPLYCDAGPQEGDTRIDLTVKLYLSPEEYADYEGTESLQVTLLAARHQPARAEGER
jgi:hypothetical protein